MVMQSRLTVDLSQLEPSTIDVGKQAAHGEAARANGNEGWGERWSFGSSSEAHEEGQSHARLQHCTPKVRAYISHK